MPNLNCEGSHRALVVDTITSRSHRLVMPEARAGGERGTASSSTPVCCQINAVYTAVFRLLHTLIASHDLWKPATIQIQTPFSDTSVSQNGPPFPGGGRTGNDIRKNAIFGPIKVDDWFCGPKTFVFSFRKPCVRDALRQTIMGSKNRKQNRVSPLTLVSGLFISLRKPARAAKKRAFLTQHLPPPRALASRGRDHAQTWRVYASLSLESSQPSLRTAGGLCLEVLLGTRVPDPFMDQLCAIQEVGH